ncbi:MAG: TSUP family transporter [Cytophagaceae bacterium]|nr:TSUP family transporter [Cytophagaceae bacterium]
MTVDSTYLLLFALGAVAFLYASVGHGGASGYLAVLALFGTQPELMKSSALMLNLVVSMISFLNFYRGGHFRWAKFWPFAVASVPMAFIGAGIPLSAGLYKQLLGLCLLLAIARMLWRPRDQEDEPRTIPLLAALLTGAGIGLLSGMLGIGGGILLSPVLLLMHWARLKETAAISALFIFVNSLSGLSKLLLKGYTPDSQTLTWLAVALVGGLLGGYVGARRFNVPTLRYALATGLFIATLKLMLT